MYIDELVKVFEEALSKYGVLGAAPLNDELKQGLISRKYDLQDEAMIETIIKQDRDELLEAFVDALDRELENTEPDDYLNSEKGKREAVRLYITSLEHMINFYYNSLVGKHFSST
jgi:hypothetical protein